MQLDEAVKQTFVELQAKFIGLRREKDQVAGRIRIAQTEVKRAALTAEELHSVPESAGMYEQIGRAYFLAPKARLMQELADAQQQHAADGTTLKEKHVKLEAASKSAEGELRELLSQNPALQHMVVSNTS